MFTIFLLRFSIELFILTISLLLQQKVPSQIIFRSPLIKLSMLCVVLCDGFCDKWYRDRLFSQVFKETKLTVVGNFSNAVQNMRIVLTCLENFPQGIAEKFLKVDKKIENS